MRTPSPAPPPPRRSICRTSTRTRQSSTRRWRSLFEDPTFGGQFPTIDELMAHRLSNPKIIWTPDVAERNVMRASLRTRLSLKFGSRSASSCDTAPPAGEGADSAAALGSLDDASSRDQLPPVLLPGSIAQAGACQANSEGSKSSGLSESSGRPSAQAEGVGADDGGGECDAQSAMSDVSSKAAFASSSA
uniref:Uncharacterized protein n=1 Tax=Zooxanthella nutricula TaxID=1333877 RepID=A0A7S2P3A3_9DINO